MKKKLCYLTILMLMAFGAFAMTGCGDDYDISYDDSYDSYDSDDSYDSYDSGGSYDSYDSGGSYDSYDSYDSGDDANFGDYDYDSNGEISDGEFQDAVNDYMDSNGY